MSKRKNQADGDDGPTESPGTASTTENPPASCGLKNTLHGNVFQLKLLMLFLVRGISTGFQFRLGTEMPGMGGKFDDLIFKFKKSDQTSESYRFLQAKHKQDEEKGTKITASDLLKDDDGEFSLPKYFRSYYSEVMQIKGIFPENVQDCIICTNIGFDRDEELKKGGIGLIPLGDHDNILSFNKISDKKTPAHYRLVKTDELRRIMAGWSHVHLLAKTLLEYVNDKKQLTLNSPIFKSYHVALIHEKVIDKKNGKLCTSFLEGDNSRFCETLSEITFVNYMGKLKLKRDDKKKSRVGNSKKLTHFDVESLKKLLRQYSEDKKFNIFEDFYDDLIAEKVIDGEGRTSKNESISFTDNFLHGINLSPEGLEFRGKLRNAVFIHYWEDLTIQLSKSFGINRKKDENKSLNDLVGDEEIVDFLDRLVFAVHTPNEVELNAILKKEVGNYYNLHENDFQSDFILRNMLDWFKEKESKFMSSEEGKNIFKEGKKKLKSLRVTAISIDYQKQLKEVLEFNEKAIEEMKEKLTQLLTAGNRIGRIATPWPKRTAVKVIAALEKLKEEKNFTHNIMMLQEYFQYEDSYLVTSSSRLQKDCSKFKKILKSEHSHNLLVVVYEDGPLNENDEFYQKLVKKMQNKRIIIISQSGAEVEDKLNFGDLNEESKRALLEKQIDFQSKMRSVEDLIKRGDTTLDDQIENGVLEKVIDCNSIEELLVEKGEIVIATCSSARFDPELYVERQLEFPWENSFYDQLAESLNFTTDELQKECVVDSQGCIQWFIAEGSRKKEIWEHMKIIVKEKEKMLSNGVVVSEKNLIDNNENRKGRVFIISGLAGTGKSTILSNYYERIKENNPDTWVIMIDLVDYSKELAEFHFFPDNQSSAIAFFADIFAKDSPFARSLLTHRFQTGGRIVVMLDGFDEIDRTLHESVFQLIRAISFTKVDALYITTRSHLKGKLQDKFFQFSYNLKNFSQEDQVACLSQYWGSKLEMTQAQNEQIRLFSKLLVERLAIALNKSNSDFIAGNPLQCRVLAECYETQLQHTLQQGLPIATLIEDIIKEDLDLANLYSLLMKKKRNIYKEEKFKAVPHNVEANNRLIKNTTSNLKRFLRKLAIKTIVFYPKHVDVLLEPSFQSDEDIRQEEEGFASDGVRFGFLDRDDKGKVKFLHRTYAEYLLAKYVMDAGFLCEKKEVCNKLLTSESARELIFSKILINDQYNGVRVFSNSMLKRRVRPTYLEPYISLKTEQYKQACSYMLGKAFYELNSNIFLLACDILDMLYSRETLFDTSLRNIRDILSKFTREDFFFVMHANNSQVFERYISYYDINTDSETARDILIKILYEPIIYLEDNELYTEKSLSFMTLVVDLPFWKTSTSLQNYIEKEVGHILKFFFCDRNYNSLSKKFLELLSSAYSDSENMLFANILVDTFKIHRFTGEYVKEILRILRCDLRRYEVLTGISRQILKLDTEIFKGFYQPEKEEGDSLPINIQSLLVRDSHGMTRLHRAALYDYEETVDQILETIRISYLSNETESKNWGKKMLHNVIFTSVLETGITPLHVAAACEHENLCQKMLIFLKKMLSEDDLRKYLTDKNGLLCNALWDAMEWKKVKMFRIIWESTKEIFGQCYLIDLWDNPKIFRVCDIDIVKPIGGDCSIERIIFIISHIKSQIYSTEQRRHIRNSLDSYYSRYKQYTFNACEMEHTFILEILGKLTPEQRVQCFRKLISNNFESVDSGKKSDFDRWLASLIHSEILKYISGNLGQSGVNELLVRNEFEVMKMVLRSHDGYSISLVDSMLTFLSNEKDEIEKMVLQLIEIITKNCQENNENYPIREILNLVFQHMENCLKKNDLSKLVALISNKASNKREKLTIWIDYLAKKGNAKNVDKFLKSVLREKCDVEKLVQNEAVTQVLKRQYVDQIANALLRHVSKEKRAEIELEVMKNAPATLLGTEQLEERLFFWKNILQLQYVTQHADRDVLEQLIKIITQSYKSYPDSDRTTSVWSSYLFCENDDLRPENVDKFLLCVSNNLGKNKVKELVLHSCQSAQQSVIQSAASRRAKDLVDVMLAHLTEEDRQEVQRDHVDTAVDPDTVSFMWDTATATVTNY